MSSGESCISEREHLLELAGRCQQLPLASGKDEPTAVLDDCVALDGLVAEVLTELEDKCTRGDGPLCSLVGAAYQGFITRRLSIELASPRCKKLGARCHGRTRSAARLALRLREGAKPNNEAARKWLQAGCDASDVRGCVELAQSLALDQDPKATRYYRRGCELKHPASCVEAIYRSTRNNITDRKLELAVAKVLAKQCGPRASAALICNALGFMTERGLITGKQRKLAGEIYSQACFWGSTMACANTVLFGVNHRRRARGLKYETAPKRLAEACDVSKAEPEHLCTAYGVLLKRGLGSKRNYRKGSKLLRTLCRGSYKDACGL